MSGENQPVGGTAVTLKERTCEMRRETVECYLCLREGEEEKEHTELTSHLVAVTENDNERQ